MKKNRRNVWCLFMALLLILKIPLSAAATISESEVQSYAQEERDSELFLMAEEPKAGDTEPEELLEDLTECTETEKLSNASAEEEVILEPDDTLPLSGMAGNNAESESVYESKTQPESEPETPSESESETFFESESEMLSESESESESETEAAKKVIRALPENPSGLNVEPYIQKNGQKEGAVVLYYRDKNSVSETDWVVYDSSMPLPGDAQLKVHVFYEQVPIYSNDGDSLIGGGGYLYLKMSPLLRAPSAQGPILDNDRNVIGQLHTTENAVYIQFNQEWIEEHLNHAGEEGAKNHYISGDFYFTSTLNLEEIEKDPEKNLVIGEVVIDLNHDNDMIARYGTLDLKKTSDPVLTEENGAYYITWTITAEAGKDGMPEVTIKDRFSRNAQFISEYVGVTAQDQSTADTAGNNGPVETSTDAQAQSGMVRTEEDAQGQLLIYTIPDMKPGEIRTLTYRTKTTADYVGIRPTGGSIQNTAQAWSKEYEKGSASADFLAKADAKLMKCETQITDMENGWKKITYFVHVSAPASNSFPMKNIKVNDYLNQTAFVSYDPDSFRLYEGGADNVASVEGLTELPTPDNPHEGQGNPVLGTGSNKAPYFDYYIGDLAPGTSKTLTYDVLIDPEFFLQHNDNEEIRIRNDARAYSDDTRVDGNQQLGYDYSERYLNHKVWSRKAASDALDEAVEIPMEGTVYEDAHGTLSKDSSFTADAGSFLYKAVINEAGDWKIGNAVIKDSLNTTAVQYDGYVKISAYDIHKGAISSSQNQDQVISSIEAMTPARTVWMKIEGSEFSFVPKDLRFDADSAQAFLLTYYAEPASDAYTVVKNRVVINGKVEIGDGVLTLPQDGILTETQVTHQGSSAFTAQKEAWRFVKDDPDKAEYQNGSAWWVLTLKGDSITKHTVVKDTLTSNVHTFRRNSVAGVYKGALPDGQTEFSQFSDLTEVEDAGLVKLQGNVQNGVAAANGDDYNWTATNTELTMRFLETIELSDDEALYVVVKTQPTRIPGQREELILKNKLFVSRNDGADFVEYNEAVQTVKGSEGVIKEPGDVIQWDGSKMTMVTDTAKKTPPTSSGSYRMEPGTYVSWTVNINRAGNMEGLAEVTDDIPEGVEPVYVWYQFANDNYRLNNYQRPTVPTSVDGLTEENGWVRFDFPDASNSGGACTSFWNKETGLLRWNVEGLKSGMNYAVEFMIVCKVTDPEVLLDGKAVTYTNRAEVSNKGSISADTADVRVQTVTLTKDGTYQPATDGNRHSFTIRINPLGEDLIAGSEELHVIDEMSSNLVFDIDTIEVKKTGSEEPLEEALWSVSVTQQEDRKQTLRITVPDHMALTIRYKARVNAAPGVPVAISNKAHWEGHASGGDDFEDDDFRYEVGGSAGIEKKPSLVVKKTDLADVDLVLQGAVFALKAMKVTDDGTLVEDPDMQERERTTDEYGIAHFSDQTVENERWMEFNTVYRLTEMKAPDGYIKDPKPYYFILIAEEGTLNVPPLPEKIPDFVDQIYGEMNYKYTAYNGKGEARLVKLFKDGQGHTLNPAQIPNGTYSFGIFEKESPTEADCPIQKLRMHIKDGQITYQKDGQTVSDAVFDNLALDTDFYIYELDANGHAILPGGSVDVAGKIWNVSYTNNPIRISSEDVMTFDTETVAPVVTVENRLKAFIMPETGGMGTNRYQILGLLCLSLSLMGYLKMEEIRKKKNKYRRNRR